jgi:putative tricarboxylic transport membrane protein
VAIRIAALVLLVFAAGFLWEASRYPFGSVGSPGPGFLPVTLGTAFAVLSLVLLIRPGLPPEDVLPPDRAAALRIGITIVAITLSILLLDRLGFLVTGTLLMLAMLLFLDRRPIRAVLLAPVSTFLVYAVFKVWLRVPLPAGLLSF